MSALTVAEVLALPVLRNGRPHLVAGAEGTSRKVRWVHTTELADIARLLREGDLLLSTGIAMPDTGPDLVAYATSLAESEAAGLIVELGRRWTQLPTALVAAFDHLGLPLVALEREVQFAAVAQAVGERIVDHQVAELREAHRVHETFTELSIGEAGPSEILDAVQRLAGGAVVLESEEHQVLDYRAGADDASTFLDSWTLRSRASHVEQRTAWEESRGWLITRVGRRDRGWGRLVLQSPTPPSERLVAIAERAAAALALHRLHDRQRDSAVRRSHHELLLGVLTDPTGPDLLRRCELAGLLATKRLLVGLTVRPQFEHSAATTSSGTVVEEVIAATVRAAHELRVSALVCEIERDVRVLVSVTTSTAADRVVDELAARVLRRHAGVAGAGRPVSRLSDADRTLREAQHVVQSLRSAGTSTQVHRLEDAHLRGLLAMLVDDDRLRLYVSRELDSLREHDARSGDSLVDTVRALLQHPGSKSDAAASLHLSRPVFYDRLARAAKVLGVDLNDPDIRVSLHVALMADEVARQAG